MGSCTSRPQVLLTEKGRDTVENLDEETERFETAPVLAPVRVFRDGQEAGVAITTTPSGTVHFGVEDDLEKAREAALLLQDSLKGHEAGKELENLALLQSMGIEVCYSSSTPFIGKLTLKFLEVTNTRHAEHTYVKVRCEGDRGRPIYATSRKEGQDDAAVFEDAVFIFIILHSDAHMLIKVRDTKENTFYGQVKVSIRDVEEGTHLREFSLYSPKDSTATVATITASVTYEYLRGTKDEGSYLGPSRVLINKRRTRGFKAAGVKSALEYISQQNHWMLSHDNVWNPLSSTPEAETSGNDDDEDTLAVDARTPSRMAFLQTQSGNMRGMCKGALYRRAVSSAKREENGNGAMNAMTQSTLLDALAPKESDREDVGDLKQELLALMLAMHERIQSLEVLQDQQNLAIQDLMKGLAASTGQESGSETDRQPFISGTFEYGVGRPAAKRKVYLFANKAQDQEALTAATVQFLGVFKTDKRGKLNSIAVPQKIADTPGHYSIVGLLPEDHTFSKGSLFILAPGTKCVIFDLDGTITVGDHEVVTVFALDSMAAGTSAANALSHKYDVKARMHALHAVRAWAAKGYQPIYLSGRQGSYYNLTLEWLIRHNYPPGPIHLTRTHMPTLPVYYSVGNFKVAYMESLKAKGLELFAAYGNTGTDARAYAAAGISKERTFMVGPHGGKWGTVKVGNFTDHIPEIFKFPDAELPIPYTELLITATPGYKKAVKGVSKGRSKNTYRESLSTLSTSTADTVEDPDASLSVSDSADVEEDNSLLEESDDEEVSSPHAGTNGSILVAVDHGTVVSPQG
ncbi:g6576 [Coccomyxa elongata]